MEVGEGPGEAGDSVEASGGQAALGVQVFEEALARFVDRVLAAEDRAGDLAVECHSG